MPLRKLWNSLRRKSNPSNGSLSHENTADSGAVEQGVVKLEKATFKRQCTSQLCQTIARLAPQTILEIGVDDGTRALEYLSGLSAANQSVRYFAIDQFELAGGKLSLREFHQLLRSAGIRPQLFPESMVAGLTRFSHTIGSADMILVADEISDLQRDTVYRLLGRVSNSQTSILQPCGKQWVTLSIDPQIGRRAA